jgi:predicted metal-binding membrane protein
MSTSLRAAIDRTADLTPDTVDRTTAVVTAMLGLDVVWWLLLYDGHVPMPRMTWLLMDAAIPMAAPGAMERAAFHVGTLEAVVGYAVMWGVMMWAMMQPAMTRFTREYAAAYRGSAVGAARALASFLVGYYAVWMASACIPLLYESVLPGGIYGVNREYTHLVIGSVLVLTGLYQLSGFKRSLLRSCCATVPPHLDGVLRGIREGLYHGTRCVLTTFGIFFLVMVFVGEMNLVWMIALTGIVTIERLPSWGEELAVGTGLVSLVAGVTVLVVQPALPVAFTL